MALPLDKLGTVFEERTAVIDGERAKAYAAATNSPAAPPRKRPPRPSSSVSVKAQRLDG